MPDEQTRRLVEEQYPRIATQLLTPLLELMAGAREAFLGDLDKFLIIVAIGLRTTTHPEFRALRPEQIREGAVAVLPNLGINTRSIADSLRIPKETVRRKVAELVEAGWLVRIDRRLYLTETAMRGLVPLRDQLMDLAVSFEGLVAQLKAGR